MLSVAVTRPNEIKLVDIPEPVPGPYQAKVRLEVACLCNATDRKLVEGHFPGVETLSAAARPRKRRASWTPSARRCAASRSATG